PLTANNTPAFVPLLETLLREFDRAAVLWSNPSAMESHILGIDLGGTKVLAAVLDAEGRIVARSRAKTRASRDDDEVFATIASAGRRALEAAGLAASDLAAVGVAAAAPIDSDTAS